MAGVGRSCERQDSRASSFMAIGIFVCGVTSPARTSRDATRFCSAGVRCVASRINCIGCLGRWHRRRFFPAAPAAPSNGAGRCPGTVPCTWSRPPAGRSRRCFARSAYDWRRGRTEPPKCRQDPGRREFKPAPPAPTGAVKKAVSDRARNARQDRAGVRQCQGSWRTADAATIPRPAG